MEWRSEQLIDDLVARTEQVILDLQTLHVYGEEQLNWRPREGGWSILECIKHLMFYGDHYNPEFRRRIDSSDSSSAKYHRMTWLGRKFAKSVSPDTRDKKIKTLKSTNPIGSELDPTIVDQLLQQQSTLLAILTDSKSVNLGKVRVSTSLAWWLKISLGDMLIVHVNHNQRHIQQIKEVIAMPNFPSSNERV